MLDQEILKNIAYYLKTKQFQRILSNLKYTTDNPRYLICAARVDQLPLFPYNTVDGSNPAPVDR